MKRTARAFVLAYLNGNDKLSPLSPWRLHGCWAAFGLRREAAEFRARFTPAAKIVRATLVYDDAKHPKRKKSK